MKKFKGIFFLSIILMLILSACSSSEQSGQESTEQPKESTATGEKVLNVAIPADPKTLDGHFLGSLAQYAVGQTIYNRLVTISPGKADLDSIEGDLAESWESNDEKTQWTFYLKQGVQWHKDYGELTSEDVKWTMERIKDQSNGIAISVKYQHIESIETPDKYTVVFNLNRPDPYFLNRGIVFIMKKEAVEAEEVIGTGPFVLDEYNTQDYITVVKNKDYFKGEPKIDKVVFKVMTDPTAIDVAMDKGEIHMAHGTTDPLWIEERRKNPDIILEPTQPFSIGSFYLKVTTPPFDDIKVRQAIALAIDAKSYSEGLIAEEIGGLPKGMVPWDVKGFAEVGTHEYNVEKAKQLLKEAGYEDGLKLPTQYISQAGYASRPMVFAQDQLKKIGIELPLETVDDTTYTQYIREGRNSITYTATNRIPHVIEWFYDFFYGPSAAGTKGGLVNFSHYSGSDDLIEQALVETDEAKAESLFKQIQENIKNDYVVIPLADYAVMEARRKEVDLGYNNNKHEGNIYYYPIITEKTDLVQ